MEGTLATITMFAGNFAPKNWMFCGGQIILISQNTAVFALIGTTYGGNGTQNFALPDLRGRVPIGQGSGPGLTPIVLGEMSGAETATMTTLTMPSHTHAATVTVGASSGNATFDQATGNVPANVGPDLYAAPAAANGALAPGSMSIQPVGSNAPFSLIQPVLCMNYVFCMQGVFPARN